jgi:hypothetical protein
MNLALPAVVLFVLLLPGFVARSRIKRVERLSLDYSPFGQVATEAVIWSMALHLLWVALVRWITGRDVQPEVALRLLSTDPAAQTRSLDAVAADAGAVTAYVFSLLVFAYLAPLGLRWIVSRWRLDRRASPFSPLLRFSGAPWYYLLSGADFDADDEPDVIAISAIVNVAGQPMLYVGLLEDYFLTQEGELDRLVLQQVMRRPLARDKAAGGDPALDRFYPVEGDYFVLRYSEAITLNVEYIKLTPAGESVAPANDQA